jgi:hypothetical protein
VSLCIKGSPSFLSLRLLSAGCPRCLCPAALLGYYHVKPAPEPDLDAIRDADTSYPAAEGTPVSEQLKRCQRADRVRRLGHEPFRFDVGAVAPAVAFLMAGIPDQVTVEEPQRTGGKTATAHHGVRHRGHLTGRGGRAPVKSRGYWLPPARSRAHGLVPEP